MNHTNLSVRAFSIADIRPHWAFFNLTDTISSLSEGRSPTEIELHDPTIASVRHEIPTCYSTKGHSRWTFSLATKVNRTTLGGKAVRIIFVHKLNLDSRLYCVLLPTGRLNKATAWNFRGSQEKSRAIDKGEEIAHVLFAPSKTSTRTKLSLSVAVFDFVWIILLLLLRHTWP